MGRLSDKRGIKFGLGFSQLCALVGIAMVVLSTWLGKGLLFPAVFIFGYGASTTSLMGALIPKAVFGERDYAKILSYTSTAMAAGTGIVSPLYGYIYDVTGSYLPSFAFAMGVSVLCVTAAFYAIALGKKLMEQYG